MYSPLKKLQSWSTVQLLKTEAYSDVYLSEILILAFIFHNIKTN